MIIIVKVSPKQAYLFIFDSTVKSPIISPGKRKAKINPTIAKTNEKAALRNNSRGELCHFTATRIRHSERFHMAGTTTMNSSTEDPKY